MSLYFTQARRNLTRALVVLIFAGALLAASAALADNDDHDGGSGPRAEAVTIDTNFVVYTPRVRLERPAGRARATVVLLTGGNGLLDLSAGPPTDPLNDQGTITQGTGNFLIRSADLFLRKGFNVMMADVCPAFCPNPTPGITGIGLGQRLGGSHASHLQGIVNAAADRWGKPVWVVGTSNGSVSAVTAGGFAPALTGIKGIVLTSSRTDFTGTSNPAGLLATFSGYVANINRPTLVMWHKNDSCGVTTPANSAALFAAIPSMNKRSIVIMGGHSVATDNCGAFSEHGYTGVEKETVDKIANFIKDNP